MVNKGQNRQRRDALIQQQRALQQALDNDRGQGGLQYVLATESECRRVVANWAAVREQVSNSV